MNNFNNMELNLTRHSIKRINQRGISFDALKLVIACCDVMVSVGSGCSSFKLSEKEINSLKKEGIQTSLLDKAKNLIVIVCDATGDIISVFKDYKNKRSKRYRKEI